MTRKKLFIIGFWLSLLSCLWGYCHLHGLSAGELSEQLAQGIRSSSCGPLLFVAAYSLLPLLFFSATALTVISGAIFGPLWGVIYTVVGTTISASVAYLLGRFLGFHSVSEWKRESGLGRCRDKLRGKSFVAVLAMRLMFVPFDLVNYASGAVGVRYTPFISATILGSIGPIVFFVMVGHGIF